MSGRMEIAGMDQTALALPMSNSIALPERAQRIRDLVGVARTCIIEIGRELIAAKADVGHGGWMDWIESEFGWSEMTATKYIRVARAFESKPDLDFAGLTIDATALYALAAPDVPQAARDDAIARAEDGEHISKADAESLITDALRAERAKFEAIVAELQASAEVDPDNPPDIPTIVEQLCQATGRKKLKPAQFQHLACILGTAITDGSKVYPPSTFEESQEAEERLRISAPALRALEYFLAAPDPDVVIDALRPFQADTARRCLAVAVSWLGNLDAHLGRR
jgi:hypothetical protein